MNRDRHMIMQACEEIIANQGRMTGIDEALLDNLAFSINVHLGEEKASPEVAKAMAQFDEVMNGIRSAF